MLLVVYVEPSPIEQTLPFLFLFIIIILVTVIVLLFKKKRTDSNLDTNGSFCPQCGNQLFPGKKFCTKCGTEVDTTN